MNMLFSQSLCLVFLMFLIPLSSYGLNQEAGYLQKMKLGFDDPDGFFKSWTGDDDSPCSWTGVTCSEPGSTGSVVSVDLSNANIAGPFPVSLPELTELKVLDLTGNNFSGDIPASYGQFQSLEVISLVDNLISGKIPAVVGNITTLKQLNLSYNPFTAGEIPAEIGKLKNLEVLWLTGCNLIGPIPDSLSQLGQLVDLDLAINKLSGSIPRSLTELKKVVQIELYNNSLTGELPKMGWSKMTSLRLLDFSMNLLTGNVPEELCSLQLESLNLYENEFAGPKLSESRVVVGYSDASINLHLARKHAMANPSSLNWKLMALCIEEEPRTYDEAMPSRDVAFWKEAIDDEIEGIVFGHKISKNEIEVDKAKVDVIAKLPHPTTVKGICSFLAHAGFYRRFIQDFSKIAQPMTRLLEKDTPFFFSSECIEAFQTLKGKLTESPILVAPDWDLPFELMCDASDFP
nr:receptor-like protein kinase HSL1 [Tanacetum cinerariifolium]